MLGSWIAQYPPISWPGSESRYCVTDHEAARGRSHDRLGADVGVGGTEDESARLIGELDRAVVRSPGDPGGREGRRSYQAAVKSSSDTRLRRVRVTVATTTRRS